MAVGFIVQADPKERAAQASEQAKTDEAEHNDVLAKAEAKDVKAFMDVSKIHSASRSGDTATLAAGPIHAVFDEKDITIQAGMIAKSVGQAVQEKMAQTTLKTVVINYQVVLQDKLGRETNDDLMSLSYSVADLLAAKYDNLSDEAMLDIATNVTFTDRGKIEASYWCEANQEKAMRFCGALLTS